MPLLLLFACAPSGSDVGDTGPTVDDTGPACFDDQPVGAVLPVATGFSAGTEGVARVGDRLFVSVPDGVVEVLPDGTTVPLATTGHALGLATRDGGLLVADPGEFTLDGSGADGRVLAVGLDGAVDVLADGLPNPNALAVTPWGTILVSDDTNTSLWEVTGDGADVWLDGPPSPNGLGFSPDGATLYVADTFVPDPPLLAVPVGASHVAGTPTTVTTFPTASAPDGLTVAANGDVLVAVNLAGLIERVDPATGESTILADGLDSPASLTFGDGQTWDACSVYVTSLYGDTVSRVVTGP